MRDFGTLRPGECGCAGCGEVFGSLTLFDSHQAVDHNAPVPVSCAQNPALLAMGLVRDTLGTWHTPAGLVKRARSAAQLATYRKDRERL
jgi:hypothetical protein